MDEFAAGRLAGEAAGGPEGAARTSLRFSPDSRAVCYCVRNPRKPGGLWVQDLEGGPPRRILQGSEEVSPMFACWSPDGKWLAVDAFNLKRPSVGVGDLLIVDAEGKVFRTISFPEDIKNVRPLDWLKE